MRARSLALAALLAPPLLAAPSAAAQIPTRDNDPALQQLAACHLATPSQGAAQHFLCNRDDLRRALALTRTIRIQSAPPNHASDAALTGLVHRLGKQIATPDQPAGLVITLAPTDSLGIAVGPAQVATLARLRVLIADHSGGADKLLWVEEETGDPSRPWPLIAHSTVSRFEQSAGVSAR